MKNIFLAGMLCVALAGTAQANLIVNNPGFDGCAWQYTVPGWGVWADGVWDASGSVGGSGGVLGLGWTDGKCVWQGTETAIEANTVYRLSAVVKSLYEPNNNIQSAGVQLILQDVDAGWVDIMRQNVWFWDLGDTYGTTGPWHTVSMDFDSTTKPELVGHKLAVAIANRRDGATWGGWGSAFIDEMSLNVVPEPGTLSLLGLAFGGLLLRRWK